MNCTMSIKQDQDIADIRREYTQGGLSRSDLTENPMDFFAKWFEQIQQTNNSDPTAMIVATCNSHGQPFQRTVLLKHFDDNGFVFYTNVESRKAQHIEHNNQVCLHFPWHMYERQVHITGVASRLNEDDVLKYFSSRPKESQIGAWASHQSQVIDSRDSLEKQFFALQEQYKEDDVPLPRFWGGYRVEPTSMEFWQGGAYRLHDRFIYNRSENRQSWKIERLSP